MNIIPRILQLFVAANGPRVGHSLEKRTPPRPFATQPELLGISADAA